MNSKLKLIQEPKWYQKGLSFKCTECGKCCSGAPGHVWVNEAEIETIAEHLNISKDMFIQKYLVQVGRRYSIRDLKEANYSCIFLKDNQCSIYKVRPKQCRTYPFWPDILKSQEHWRDEAQACEGIRDHYDKVPLSEIEEKIQS